MEMEKRILSVLVENQSGVLTRIAGLFARRGYNIDSLTVGTTKDPRFSRMTIVTSGDYYTVEQIKKQLNKLVDTIEVIELDKEMAVVRELCLIKVSTTDDNRTAIASIVDIFRAKIIDVSAKSLTVEMTGDQDKIDSFIKLMEPYGILELARTGLTALERGSIQIMDHKIFKEE